MLKINLNLDIRVEPIKDPNLDAYLVGQKYCGSINQKISGKKNFEFNCRKELWVAEQKE